MNGESGSSGFLLGAWRVEVTLGRISRSGDSVRIDPRNMKVLQLLASRPGELVTQAEIETTVWSGLVVTPNSVYQSVAQLRRALGDDRTHPRYIETIARKGYRLIAPVSTSPPAPAPEVSSASAPPTIETGSIPPPRSSVVPIGLAASVAALAAIAGLYWIDSGPIPSPVAAEMRDTLEGAPLTLDGTALNDAAIRAEMHFELAEQAWRRGQHELARRNLEQASVAQREVAGYRHPNMGFILTKLANVRRWGGDYAAAELLSREAMRIFAAAASEQSVASVRATLALGDALIDGQEHEEAALYVQRALDEVQKLPGEHRTLTIDAQHSLALLRLAQGRLDDAEQIARRALDGYLKLPAPDEVTSKYPYALALVLYERGRYAEAAAEARREIEQLSQMKTQHLGYMAVANHMLGRSLSKLGRCEEAEAVFRTELQEWRDTNAPRWRIARASSGLGESLLGQGRLGEAEEHLTFAADELAQARGWLARKAMEATQERLEQLREAQKTQQIRHARS
jgi:DNA-binding winged helix-turn-helix (wHTH) protein/tetratricopeptide (TPR) repeat protein